MILPIPKRNKIVRKIKNNKTIRKGLLLRKHKRLTKCFSKLSVQFNEFFCALSTLPSFIIKKKLFEVPSMQSFCTFLDKKV